MPAMDVDTPVGRLPAEAFDAVRRLGGADIVVGIPSYNNAGTIRHVVQAAEAGASKYFPQSRTVIINSDGGSSPRSGEGKKNPRRISAASRYDAAVELTPSGLMLLSTSVFPGFHPGLCCRTPSGS